MPIKAGLNLSQISPTTLQSRIDLNIEGIVLIFTNTNLVPGTEEQIQMRINCIETYSGRTAILSETDPNGNLIDWVRNITVSPNTSRIYTVPLPFNADSMSLSFTVVNPGASPSTIIVDMLKHSAVTY